MHTVMPPSVDLPHRHHGFTSALHRHTVDVAEAPGAQPQSRGYGVPGGPEAQDRRVAALNDSAARRNQHCQQLQAPPGQALLGQHQTRRLVMLQRQQEQPERLRAELQHDRQLLLDSMENSENTAEEDLARAGWSGRNEWQGRYQQWMGQQDVVFRQGSCHSSDGSAAVGAQARASSGAAAAGACNGADGGTRQLGSSPGNVRGPSSAGRPHSGPRRDPRRAHLPDARSSPIPGSFPSGGGGLTRPVEGREHRVHEQVQQRQRYGHEHRQKQVSEGLLTHLDVLQYSRSPPLLQHVAVMGTVEQFPDPRDLPQHEGLQQDAPAARLGDVSAAAPFQEPPLPEGRPRRHRREPVGLSDYVRRCTLDSHGVLQAVQDIRIGIESGGHKGPGGVFPNQVPLPLQLMHGRRAAPAEPLPCGSGEGDEGRGPGHDGDGVATGAATAARLPHGQLPRRFPPGLGPPEARDVTHGWDVTHGHVQGCDQARNLTFSRTPAHEWPTGWYQLAGWHPCDAGPHRRPQRFRRMSDLLLLPEVKLERLTESSSVADSEDEDAPERRNNGPEKEAAGAGQGSHGPASAMAAALAASMQRAARRGTHYVIVQKGCNQVKVSIPAARILFPDILPKLSSGSGQPIELYLAMPQLLRRAGAGDEVEGGDGGHELQRLRDIRLVGCGLAWALTGLRGIVRALGLGNSEKALLTAMPPPSQRGRGGSSDGGQEDSPGIIVSRLNCPGALVAAETEDGAGSAMFVSNFNGLLTVPATLAESLFPRVAASGREATLPVRAFARLPGEAELRAFPGVCLRSLFRRVVVSGLSPTLQPIGVQAGEALALRKDPLGRIVLSAAEDAGTAGTRRRGRGDDPDAAEVRDEEPKPAKRGRRGRQTSEPDVSDFEDVAAVASGDACAAGRNDDDEGNRRGAAKEVDGGRAGEGDGRKENGVEPLCCTLPRCRGAASPRPPGPSSCADKHPRALDHATAHSISQPAQNVSALAAAAAAALLAMPSLRFQEVTGVAEEAGTAAAAQTADRDAGQGRRQAPQPGEGRSAAAQQEGPPKAAAAPALAEGLCSEGSDAQIPSIIEIPSERLVFLDGRGRCAASVPRDRTLSGLGADDTRQRGASGKDSRADAVTGGDEYDRGYYDGFQDGYVDGYVDGVEDLADANGCSGRRSHYRDEPSSGPHTPGWECFEAVEACGGRVPGGGGVAVGSSSHSCAPKQATQLPLHGGPGACGAQRAAPLASLCSGTHGGASAPPLAIRVVQLPSGRLRPRTDKPGADRLQPPAQQQPQPPGPPLHLSGSASVTELEAAAWAAAEVDGLGESLSAQTQLPANFARSGCTSPPRPGSANNAQLAAAATQHADAENGRSHLPRHAVRDGAPRPRPGAPPPRPEAALTKAAALAEAEADVEPLDLELIWGLRPPLAHGAGSTAAPPQRQSVSVPVVERGQRLPAGVLLAPQFIGQGPRQQQQLRGLWQMGQHPPQARIEGAAARKRTHAEVMDDVQHVYGDVGAEWAAGSPATEGGSPSVQLRRPVSRVSWLVAAAAAAGGGAALAVAGEERYA